MTQPDKMNNGTNIWDNSILSDLHKGSLSLLFIIGSIVIITLFAYLVPYEIQKYAFFFFGIPVLYASLVYGIFYGFGISILGFGINLFIMSGHFASDLAAGNVLRVAVEGFIIEFLYFFSMLFISKIMINELEVQKKYIKMADNYAALANELVTANESIKAMFMSSIKALAAAIDAKDSNTKGHSERVSKYAVAVAKQMNLPQTEINNILYGAILHDIGKIGIEEKILNKPESLDSTEYDVMKKHPEIGASIVSSIKVLEPAIPIVLYHHEFYNGKGYPAGLKGEEIPLGARIVAVVDAYDAITSQRPYRGAETMEKAIEALRAEAGKQFDPEIIEVFVKVLSNGNENYSFPVDF